MVRPSEGMISFLRADVRKFYKLQESDGSDSLSVAIRSRTHHVRKDIPVTGIGHVGSRS